MDKKDFYIGQKVKLPQDSYEYSWECYRDRLAEYATVSSLESLHNWGIVHYEIKVLGEFSSTIHSGIDYKLLKEYNEKIKD